MKLSSCIILTMVGLYSGALSGTLTSATNFVLVYLTMQVFNCWLAFTIEPVLVWFELYTTCYSNLCTSMHATINVSSVFFFFLASFLNLIRKFSRRRCVLPLARDRRSKERRYKKICTVFSCAYTPTEHLYCRTGTSRAAVAARRGEPCELDKFSSVQQQRLRR